MVYSVTFSACHPVLRRNSLFFWQETFALCCFHVCSKRYQVIGMWTFVHCVFAFVQKKNQRSYFSFQLTFCLGVLSFLTGMRSPAFPTWLVMGALGTLEKIVVFWRVQYCLSFFIYLDMYKKYCFPDYSAKDLSGHLSKWYLLSLSFRMYLLLPSLQCLFLF